MLRFFRQIRQRLITDNKFSKYLLYAVGEILLVVIGILIALQINNWNEERKQAIRSLDYHERLLEDLNRLVEQNQEVTSRADRTLRSITKTVELLESGSIVTERDKKTVDFAMIWFSRTNYQMPKLPTYDEMKSNGDLNLIYSIELRDQIANFQNFLEQVEDVVSKLSTAIESDFQIFNRHLRSYVDPESLEVTYSYDFKEMAGDEVFVNTFSRLSYHWRGYVYFMQRVLVDAESLKYQLAEELESEEKN